MKSIDVRAKKILFDTYWTSKGWIDKHERKLPSAADRAHAKRHGMWFEPIKIGHDALLKQTKQLAKRMAWADVTAAFLASLSTRRLASAPSCRRRRPPRIARCSRRSSRA